MATSVPFSQLNSGMAKSACQALAISFSSTSATYGNESSRQETHCQDCDSFHCRSIFFGISRNGCRCFGERNIHFRVLLPHRLIDLIAQSISSEVTGENRQALPLILVFELVFLASLLLKPNSGRHSCDLQPSRPQMETL